jgi:hypothetical protein
VCRIRVTRIFAHARHRGELIPFAVFLAIGKIKGTIKGDEWEKV